LSLFPLPENTGIKGIVVLLKEEGNKLLPPMALRQRQKSLVKIPSQMGEEPAKVQRKLILRRDRVFPKDPSDPFLKRGKDHNPRSLLHLLPQSRRDLTASNPPALILYEDMADTRGKGSEKVPEARLEKLLRGLGCPGILSEYRTAVLSNPLQIENRNRLAEELAPLKKTEEGGFPRTCGSAEHPVAIRGRKIPKFFHNMATKGTIPPLKEIDPETDLLENNPQG
jgi:hypothetical protein